MARAGYNTSGVVVPEVELFGDWAKASQLLHSLPALITAGNELGQRSAAYKLKALVRHNIIHGGPPGTTWPAYSEKYAKNKAFSSGGYGLTSASFYFKSGAYFRNIKAWRTAQGSWFVGLTPYARTANGLLSLSTVARILENGSDLRGIQARPLWKPTYDQFKGDKRTAGIILWHIRNQIYIATGVRGKITA